MQNDEKTTTSKLNNTWLTELNAIQKESLSLGFAIARIFQKDTMLGMGMDSTLPTSTTFSQDDYSEVARMVVSLAEDRADVLEDIYRETNNIDSSWAKNENKYIEVLGFASDGCRSTSVGDIIVIEDDVYAVASFGFDNIGKTCDLFVRDVYSDVYQKNFKLSDSQIEKLAKKANDYFEKIGLNEKFMINHKSPDQTLDFIMLYAEKSGADVEAILKETPRFIEQNTLSMELTEEDVTLYRFKGISEDSNGNPNKQTIFVAIANRGTESRKQAIASVEALEMLHEQGEEVDSYTTEKINYFNKEGKKIIINEQAGTTSAGEVVLLQKEVQENAIKKVKEKKEELSKSNIEISKQEEKKNLNVAVKKKKKTACKPA